MATIININSAIIKVLKSRTFSRLLPGLIILVPLILISLLAPYLPLQDPVMANPGDRQQPPSLKHFFGTDVFGMDVFSRVLHATRIDISIAVLTVLLAVFIGSTLGAVAGYFGGILELLVDRMAEIVQSFPLMLFALLIQVAVGSSVTNLVWIIAIRISPFYAKLVRSIVKPLRDIDYIQAAKLAGQTPLQILFHHLIPNALPAIISQFPLSASVSVRVLAGLSFLGLGVKTPTPEWGSMIQIGASWMMFGKWWSSVFPGLVMFLTIWSLTQIGEEIESMYTLKEQ